MRWKLSLCISLWLSASAFGACHAVGPTSAGTGNGSNWSNRMTMPATGAFVRGDVYYLMDGSYPAIDFNQSGTATVELRKAQSYDFGRVADGCSNDISTGWNTGTMGSAQAVFSQLYFGHMFFIESPGLVINGNGRQTTPGCGGAVGSDPTANPVTPTDCGIKIDNTTTQTSDEISQPGGIAYTVKYVEVHGSGNATTENYVIRADGGSGSLITHLYLHYFGAVAIVAGGTTNLEVSNSYFFREQAVLGSNPGHGQGIEIGASSSGGNIHANIWRDMSGTAAIATFLSTGTSSNWKFYDNIVWNTSGFTPFFMANGVIACINSHTCTNLTFMQNVVASIPATSAGPPLVGILSETGGSFTIQNNIWYNNNGMPSFPGADDHNSFLSTGTCPGPGGTADVCNNAASSPFVNWQNGNFSLSSDTSDVNGRASLAAPYTTDMAGVTFTTDRGALQFVSTSVPSVTLTSTFSGGKETIAITTSSLPNATHNVAYSTTLSATGGSGTPTISYTWSVVYGSLPTGISLGSSTGTISGTTSQTGVFAVVIQAVDTTGHSGKKSLALIVN